MINNRVCILGTGAWATALGLRLSLNGKTVFLWGIDNNEVNDINSGYNKKYFGDNKFASSLSATTNLNNAIGDSKYIIFAVPSDALKEVLEKLKAVVSPKSNVIFVNVIKGLDSSTNDILSKTIRKELKNYSGKLVTLCGPSFAVDVFDQKPTIINAAGKNFNAVRSVCEIFNSDVFKIIPCNDEIGLQVFSSLKNLLAIAVGIAQENHNSINTISAMLTMGIDEMQDIACHMGANKKTMISFCGIGDIFLTCTSDKSRNFSFGREIFKNGLEKTINNNKKTVEGFKVYKIVDSIIKNHNINSPVFSSIIDVLDGKLAPEKFIERCWELIWKMKLDENQNRKKMIFWK